MGSVPRTTTVSHQPARRVPMPAQVRCVPRYHDDVRSPGCDLLLATRAQVGLARLGAVNAPDVQAERLARRRQVGDLL